MFTITKAKRGETQQQQQNNKKKLYENDARWPIVCYRQCFRPFVLKCLNFMYLLINEYLSLFCGHVNTVRSFLLLLFGLYFHARCVFVEIEK